VKKLTTFIIALLLTAVAFGQNSKDYTVQIKLSVQKSPLRFTLLWNKAAAATQYKVFSKTPDALAWTELATLTASDTTYTDATVTAGVPVEYQVVKFTPTYNGYGYLYAGDGIDEYNYRGKLLLMVDSNYRLPLATEIRQLQSDLRSDGWQVVTRYVSRNSTPVKAKQHVIDLWQQDSINFKAVYLLGHIPVPYSGYVGPDGHSDHYGAWPADLYYAMADNSQWTDYVLNVKVSSSPRNYNTPGDGKFDADAITPGSAKLHVGRVDMYDMPVFGMSDTALTRRYLAKAHNFKLNKYPIVQRGFIEDAIGGFGGEAFVRGGWGSYSGMFGDSIREGDFLTELKTRPYMFSVTAGYGSYTTSSGIATSTDFVNDSLTTPFTSSFGSYFGDWDITNNLLKAHIASRSLILTSTWSGRPVYYHHQMALGHPVGYCATASANSPRNLYHSYYLSNGVTMGLMGDPTLRLHPITPATSLTATESCTNVSLSWTASTDTGIIAHRIYRSSSFDGKYELIGQTAGTTFLDAAPLLGKNHYMVKALRLQKTPAGTYYNTSLGIIDSANFLPAPKLVLTVNDSEQCEFNNTFIIKKTQPQDYTLPYTERWWIDGQQKTYTDSLVESFIGAGSFNASVAVVSSGGCYDSIVTHLLVNPVPQSGIVLVKGGDCTDSTNVQLLSPATGVSYTWVFSDGDTLYTQQVAKNFADSGWQTVKLIVEDLSTACINDFENQTVYAKLKPAPKASILINNTAQCLNGNRFVIRNGIAAYPAPYTQSWRIDGQTEMFTDSLVKFFNTAGNYTLSYAVGITGCYDSIAIPLTVNTNPTADIIPLWEGQCADSNLLKLASNTITDKYTWKFSDGDSIVTTSPNAVKTFTTGAGSYTVQLITQNTSTGCSNSTTQNLTVLPKPVPVSITGNPFMQLGRPFTYQAQGQPSYNYTWVVSQTPDLMQVNKDSITLRWDNTLLAAVIKLVVRDTNGCKSDTSYFNVWTIINSTNELNNNAFEVYPIPVSNNVLYINNLAGVEGKTTITVMDAAGKTVINKQIALLQGENKLEVDGLASGVYYISLQNGTQVFTQKISKQ
jgi:hypothetical protein